MAATRQVGRIDDSCRQSAAVRFPLADDPVVLSAAFRRTVLAEDHVAVRDGERDQHLQRARAPLLGEEGRERFVNAGFPLLQAEDVARAVLTAARSAATGQVWVVQPGREPLQFRFPNVPGPRDASGAPVGAPPLS